MALILYDNPLSGNCYKVRLLLALLGIDFERRELSVTDHSGRSEALGGLSPSLKVPTVVLADGRPLCESNAILCHLAEGTTYLPDDPYERAQVLQWMFFEQYSHEPGIAVLRFWLAILVTEPPRPEAERLRAIGEAALSAMETWLSEHAYFVGGRFTVADIALHAYTHVAPEGGFDLGPYRAIREWIGRVEDRPRFVPITA